MNIEIIGVWPANKGAMLMLEAVRDRLQRDFPDMRLAAPMDWPVEERLRASLWATPGRVDRRPTLTSLFERLPERLHAAVGFIPRDRIDVILDASGFGYGDFWGLPKLDYRLNKRLAHWKNGRKKAILLPQALGPFEEPGMAEAFRGALDRLDIAFVRDSSSAAFVEAVAPGHRAVRRAPDFTNLLHPELPRRLDDLRGLPVVIPNEKMVTGKSDAVRANYLAFLKTAIDMIRAAGKAPFILVHEGAKDRALAHELNALLDTKARIVDEASALDTKAVISVAELSVSSRFHGLVSGLSAAVPSLACGWSHKYRELMADYGCPDLIVDIEKPDSWAGKFQLLLDSAAAPGFRSALAAKGEEERAKSEAMWSEVVRTIA
ncbi:polysaccharide pyruvyl transferase family protein [Sphingomonas montanisoli]|nr:polysaccharide pyruvyl transferase family protein [Sphingomonas montanisoli]